MDKPCIYIPINVSASEIDWGLLNLFKKRFNILRSNYKDLDLGLIQGAFSIDKGNRYSGSFNLPNEFRLKGLYVDYRHFYLNNEPTNFFKVANYINKLTTDQNFRNFISEEKKKFRSSFIEEDFFKFKGTPFKTKEILDIWFNAEIFHNDEIKADQLLTWMEVLNEETAKSMLFMAVFDTIHVIRNLNWVISDSSPNNLNFRMPNKNLEDLANNRDNSDLI